MRNLRYSLLLGASALALAPAAHAADGLSAGVGGELSQYFGYVSNDEDGLGGFDLKSYGEVGFGGELELDNGLTVGVEVVMVGTQGEDDAIDGSHMTIGGGHGLFEIGQLDNVAATMQVSAPDVGLGVNESDIGDWVFSPSDADDDSAFAATYLYLGEGGTNKINYYTPRMNGLQFGVSYMTAFEREGQGMPERDAAARDAFAFGANYEAEFGDAAVAVSAGYLTADAPGEGVADASGFSLGVNVSVGNVTVGASWASTEGHPEGGTDIPRCPSTEPVSTSASPTPSRTRKSACPTTAARSRTMWRPPATAPTRP